MDNVGSIEYDARINSSNFDKDASTVENRASQVAASVDKSGGGFSSFASQASNSFGTVADGLGRVLKSALIIGTTGSVGIGAMTAASWNQVSAVQQATVAMGAYEKDTGKVNKTLGELVAYARSDLGVLFNRKDLFAAAQGLAIMGDNTAQLTDHVKIMSRSVGLGLSTWDNLSEIVGRVGSTGHLTGIDFDNLTKAGFRLDDGLRNTDITFEQLFKAMDKGIPADAMAGQANTIVGMGVRLQTAFRNIGDAILGVDKDSGQFVKGGLGDRLVGMMGTLTTIMKDPGLIGGFKKMGQAIGDFAQAALPIVLDGFKWFVNNISTVVAGIVALGVAFVGAKVAAIGFSIAATIAGASPIGLLVAAVVGLIAGLTFLQVQFDIFGKAMAFLKPVTDIIGKAFTDLYNIFVTYVLPILKQVGTYIVGQLKSAWDNLVSAISKVSEALSPFISQGDQLKVILGLLLSPLIILIAGIAIFIGIIIAVVTAGATLINWISQAINWFIQFQTSVYNSITNFVSTIVNGISQVVGAISGFLAPILKFIGDLFTIIFGSILIVVLTVFSAIYNAVSPIFSAIYATISSIITGLFNFWVGIWNNILNFVVGIGAGIYNAISKPIGDVIGVFNGIKDKVIGALNGAANWLFNIGKDIVGGLIRGIQDAIGGAVNAVSNMADSVRKAASKALDIHSPSRVFADIGKNVVLGFAQGIDNNAALASNSMGNMLGSVGAPGMSSTSGSLGSLDSAQMKGGNSIVNNINSITIGSEVDADRVIRRLTGDQEIIQKGLVPQTSYA